MAFLSIYRQCHILPFRFKGWRNYYCTQGFYAQSVKQAMVLLEYIYGHKQGVE
jgi:hypothetical protein